MITKKRVLITINKEVHKNAVKKAGNMKFSKYVEQLISKDLETKKAKK